MHPDTAKYRAKAAWRKAYGPIPKGTEVDHWDGNVWNNSIGNLRLATRQQNSFNRKAYRTSKSGEKGVIFHKRDRLWRVRVVASPIRIDSYASHKISAIVAARLIRRVLHGEFAYENRPTTHPA
jgi:hypothetical protein